MSSYLLQEDGSSKFILEDGSGDLLREGQGLDVPFISSVTAVHAPQLNGAIGVPFISSSTTTPPRGSAPLRDDFTRANSTTSLGPGWTGPIHPGGFLAYTANPLGVSSNQGYKPAAENLKSSAYWNGAVFTGMVEAFLTLSTLGPDIYGIVLRARNPNGSTVQFYLVRLFSATPTDWTIERVSDQATTVSIATGSHSGWANGDKLGARIWTNDSGDVVIEVWANHGSAGWQLIGSYTDTAAQKITADGYVGVVWGNTAGDTSGRFDDFYAGEVRPLTLTGNVAPSFISSVTTVYAPSVQGPLAVPFIASTTVVYAPSLPVVPVPFISSRTRVFGVFSLFDTDATGSGAGNGGETFAITLSPNGTSVTATLTANLSSSSTLLHLSGDSGLPTSTPFVLTVDAEVIYVAKIAAGIYRVRGRGVSNTTPASHSSGTSAVWSDSYDMAITAAADIAHEFTADITSTGSYTYPGWLICFDSTQAYLSGSRYPMHVTEVVGVFDAGAGTTGSNRLDASQPNAIASTAATSNDCPAALSNPARIATNILTGDVAVVRYTNPEASALELVARSVALQSWFGIKRVDATDNDVTLTDPTGHSVDGSVNGEWLNPLGPGIAPDTGDPTSHDVPYTSVTLPGADRYFTNPSLGYSEKGWPICVLAVRQGNRRVPYWRSWDWHDFTYVYSGFAPDATFCQLLVNRNGIVYGSVPEVELPGTQDIDGPDAVWDDGSYYFGASWYIAIFAGPYLVLGPSVGGFGPPLPEGGSPVPIVSFPTGPGSPVVTLPPELFVEGGSGGNIPPPTARKQKFYATVA